MASPQHQAGGAAAGACTAPWVQNSPVQAPSKVLSWTGMDPLSPRCSPPLFPRVPRHPLCWEVRWVSWGVAALAPWLLQFRLCGHLLHHSGCPLFG